MPGRFLVRFEKGARKGELGLIFPVDYDEYQQRCPDEITLISENPSPSELLMDARGNMKAGGVLSQSELKQEQKERERFVADQIAQLDKAHEESKEEKARKDAIQAQRREAANRG